MKKTTNIGNLSMVEKESFICSLSEYKPETTLEDGAMLEVVDETTHRVVKYCVAYNGYWNER